MAERRRNFLDYVPVRRPDLEWTETDGLVTLSVVHKGLFDRMAQRFLKKPKVSRIDLEKVGSAVWLNMDGRRTVGQLADMLSTAFGEAVDPVYERTAQYVRMLHHGGYIRYRSAGQP